MHDQNTSSSSPAAATTPLRTHLRAVNASLDSMLAGLSPVVEMRYTDGGNHFIFRNGQHRRQIGFGHSKAERTARKKIRSLKKRAVLPNAPLGQLAAAVIMRERGFATK